MTGWYTTTSNKVLEENTTGKGEMTLEKKLQQMKRYVKRLVEQGFGQELILTSALSVAAWCLQGLWTAWKKPILANAGTEQNAGGS